MFAGKIRLRTFLTLAAAILVVGGGIVGAGLAGGVLYWTAPDANPPAPVLTAPVVAAAPSPGPGGPSSMTPVVATTPSTGRDADAAVLSYLGKALGTDKKKDVTSGRSYKVNVYQDAGSDVANRAKLDIDRDDKWDEKFTWKDGAVTRDVAPGDDEVYTERYRLDGATWVRE